MTLNYHSPPSILSAATLEVMRSSTQNRRNWYGFKPVRYSQVYDYIEKKKRGRRKNGTFTKCIFINMCSKRGTWRDYYLHGDDGTPKLFLREALGKKSYVSVCVAAKRHTHTTNTLYTHRPIPKDPRSPGPIKITELLVRYINPFILLLFKILWIVRRAIIQLVAKDIIYTCMCI